MNSVLLYYGLMYKSICLLLCLRGGYKQKTFAFIAHKFTGVFKLL